MKPIKTNSLRAWIVAVRPYSFGAAAIPVAAGTALAWHDGAFRWQPALLCLLFALLMQCVPNLVNDLFDFLKGSDRPDRLGPDRAFAKGYITPPAMKAGIALFTAAAAAVGIGLLWYGGWWLVWIGLLCVAAAYLYTAGPWPLAYKGLGDAAVVLFFGIVPLGFTYYVQARTWTTETTFAALACGLVIDTMLMVNNFRDREEDARCGKRTVVVRFGKGFGKWGYFALGTGAMLCCLPLAIRGSYWALALPAAWWLLLFVPAWRRMVRTDHGEALNASLGETARNLLLFGVLLTLGILIQ